MLILYQKLAGTWQTIQNTYSVRIFYVLGTYPHYDLYLSVHDPHFCVLKPVQNTYSEPFLAISWIRLFRAFLQKFAGSG